MTPTPLSPLWPEKNDLSIITMVYTFKTRLHFKGSSPRLQLGGIQASIR